ncbi:MAG: hypothetical protein IJ197_03965 [Bacteroidaceae bacterium]|nr:hypothetical protein [Bacteroidaceae bacterium]
MLLVPVGMQAQNVTIKATNGSTIASVKNGGVDDTFFGLGGFATWQHEQLSMVLTVADDTQLTPNGQLGNPANNLFANGQYMQVAKGRANGANVCYVTLSLPNGYRFTGYTIKFTKPRNAQNGEFNTGYNDQSTFGETNSTFATYMTQATITTDGAAQIITRTEGAGGTMSNVLYFKLQNPTQSRALVQLESAEFFFTAEGNYSPVTPAGEIASPVSAVDVPFSTSKVDFGPITSRNYLGSTRVSYSSANVTDLEANFKLYEAESIEDGTEIDGISGKVVKYGAGTISSSGGYFKLGRDGQEQIYYLETPTSVTLSDGTANPLGYRIVSAQIEYANQVTASRTFRIQYWSGSTNYYLNTNGRFTTTQVIWEMDSEGYISSNGNYLYFNNGYAATQSSRPASSERFGIDENGNIYQLNYPTYFITYYQQGGTRYGLISNTSGNKATYQEISTSSSSVGDFTINVYDKTGNSVFATRTDGNGTITLAGLNNDAVKFGVEGIGLVRATLTLQALDPYLDQMAVVCQDEVQTAIRLSQDFTASDFSVSGDDFYFFLPEDCAGHSVAITAENLKSKYFDETYTGGDASHTSRISFVKSDHYNAFGNSNNNVYSDRDEAANAQLERLKVGIVGTSKFKFNNADEVGESGGTLTEYPFSLNSYAMAPNNGSFSTLYFSSVDETDQVATRYVFTTDETRYNIAPTTATQHRAYAFYQMTVHVQVSNYDPQIEFKKIYDQTLYGTGQTDAFYGVVVTATDGNGKPGYSSTGKIFEKIETILNETHVDDKGNTDLPASAKQLLYLDFSQLAGIYQLTTGGQQSMEGFAAANAPNCIFFIPLGHGAPSDNVCYKTEAGTYMAANNIVLTDKEPFYTPYNIYFSGEAQKVTYKRKITKDKYGKVQNASIILPFVITVDENGTHTNPDGTSFTLHTMQANNALKLDGESTYAYFPNLSNVTITTANTPYMVKLEENSTEDGISFVVEQPGSTIYATTGMNSSDYTFAGTASTGVAVDASEAQTAGTYTFTSTGTYAGQRVPKTENIFYFANNMFVSSADLITGGIVNIAPFRAYYATNGTGAGVRLSNLDIIFGEGEGDTDAIRTLRQNDLGMSIQAGRGQLTITAAEAGDVRIAAVNGISRGNLTVKAGETRTVSVPAGIYVVNGVKVVVK